MKKKIIVATVVVSIATVVGVAVYKNTTSQETPEEQQNEQYDEAREKAIQKAIERKGKRPEEGRLRDGAKQIETNSEAISIAENELARIEKEIKENDNEEERGELIRRKRMMEKNLNNLLQKK